MKTKTNQNETVINEPITKGKQQQQQTVQNRASNPINLKILNTKKVKK